MPQLWDNTMTISFAVQTMRWHGRHANTLSCKKSSRMIQMWFVYRYDLHLPLSLIRVPVLISLYFLHDRKWIILNSCKRSYRRSITTVYSTRNQTPHVCISPKTMAPTAVQSSTRNPNSNWSITTREFWKCGAFRATRWQLRPIYASSKQAKRFACAQLIWKLVMVLCWLNCVTNRDG